MKQKLKVWDLPTRLFHWTLVLAVAFMWFSAETGGNWLVWHLRCGLLILGLLVFRLCWGFWGSDTSRFTQFVKGPAQIKRYLRGELSENEQPGHNPLGALMVLALLGGLLFQVGTGLFSTDENTFINDGYLKNLISSDLASKVHTIHVAFFNVLLALIVVHVSTIVIYRVVKKHNLVQPMFTGYKELDGTLPALKFAGAAKFIAALLVAVVVAFAVVKIGS